MCLVQILEYLSLDEEIPVVIDPEIVEKYSLPKKHSGYRAVLSRKVVLVLGIYGFLRHVDVEMVIIHRNDELNKLTWDCISFFVSEKGEHAAKICLNFPTKTHPGGDNHSFFLPDTDGTINSPFGVLKRFVLGLDINFVSYFTLVGTTSK